MATKKKHRKSAKRSKAAKKGVATKRVKARVKAIMKEKRTGGPLFGRPNFLSAKVDKHLKKSLHKSTDKLIDHGDKLEGHKIAAVDNSFATILRTAREI